MAGDERAQGSLRGLIVDWGGVLTAPLDEAMTAWAKRESVPIEAFRDVMRTWLGPPAELATGSGPAAAATPPPPLTSPVHELERGALSPEDFEITLAAALRERGAEVVSTGLLARVLGDLADLEQDMVGLVRRARRAGIKTALLSNSWGEHYPEHQWPGLSTLW